MTSSAEQPLFVNLVTRENRVWFGAWWSLCRVASRTGYEVLEVISHRTNRQAERVARRLPQLVPDSTRRQIAFGSTRPLPETERLVWVLGTDYNLASLVQCLTAMEWSGHRHTILLGETWPGTLDLVVRSLRPFCTAIEGIVVGVRSVVEPLSTACGVPVRYVPQGVDPTIAPARRPGDRRIEVINVGRRDPGQHAAIRSFAAAHDAFYHYDTLATDICVDMLEHLTRFNELLGDSVMSITNPAKFNNLSERSADQIETPGRLIEAAGQGAIPVGWRNPAHAADPFLSEVPWIPLDEDSSVWTEQLAALADDRSTLEELATTCRTTMLRGNTMAHRLHALVEHLGLEPTAQLHLERETFERAAERPWSAVVAQGVG